MSTLRKNKPEPDRKRRPAELPIPGDIKKRIQPVSALQGHLKMLLYGRSGTGKTTLASTFPSPILLIDVKDKGTDSVVDVPELDMLSAETWEDVELVYWMLKAGEHKYKTLIIDTISMAQTVLVQGILEQTGKEAMSQQLWGEVSGSMQPIVIAMRDLPMHVVFVAQDRMRSNPEGDADEQLEPEVGPQVIPSVAKSLTAAVGIVGYTYIAERMVQKGGNLQTKIEYRLRLGPHPVYITKVRSPRQSAIPDSVVDPTFEKLLKITKGESYA